MGYQSEIRAVDNAIEAATAERQTYAEGAADETGNSTISLWDRFLIAVTPESNAESIVNEIYSSPSRTLKSDPAYNVNDLSSPNVYVQAKGAVKEIGAGIAGFAGNSLLILGAFVLIGIAVYAAIPVLIRR